MLLEKGAEYFNPDEASRRIRSANPGKSKDEADIAAWWEGKRLLEHAIEQQLDFAFETTLGGQTITVLLEQALSRGIEVRMWYAGLSSPELHVARVHARVEAGGHDIPEEKIRERYNTSRANLIRLLPRLTELLVYDNSTESDPKTGKRPQPKLILHCRMGRIVKVCELTSAPTWAKPIVAAAMRGRTLPRLQWRVGATRSSLRARVRTRMPGAAAGA